MPRRALTMGVGTILDARRCVLLATGASKAEIIAKAVEGPITSMITASALQWHPRCTVVVDGTAVSGCLYLAVFVDGTDVVTVEHAAGGDGLDAVQKAFVECGGFQCGFCTPGFILMSRQLLDEKPDPTEDDIRHYLSGNLCRCAAYPEIIEAVKLAARMRREQN